MSATMTKLSLGCSAFGGVYVPMSDTECTNILRLAFDAGISLLDTAPWYKASEAVVGRCLTALAKDYPRCTYQLNTKCGRYPQGKMFDFSAKRILHSVSRSLELLQTEYLDTIQVHDCEFGNEDTIINETLPTLHKLREEGKVRKIGITGYDLTVLERILKRSTVKIDSVLSYCRYTLNDRSLVEKTGKNKDGNDFLHFLERNGVAFINASPIAMGLLCGNDPPAWHPASDNLKARCKAAAAYAAQHGSNLARLAIAFSSRHPRIPTTLVSSTSLDLMKANIDVMQNGLTSSEELLLQEILDKFFQNSEHWAGVEKARMDQKKLHNKQKHTETKETKLSSPSKLISTTVQVVNLRTCTQESKNELQSPSETGNLLKGGQGVESPTERNYENNVVKWSEEKV